jgi:23S rRNA pseudouridine2604 synthase
MSESVRLAKRVAELVPCSRSEAEQYIAGGWVSVDGDVIEASGFRVEPQHAVALLPNASLAPLEPVTILLHKPAGFDLEGNVQSALSLIGANTLTTDDRSGNRFLKRHCLDLKLVTPLEAKASGLLVLTQDWRITRKLVDDAVKIEAEYVVEVAGELIPDGLEFLHHGLSFNGRPLPPIKVSWQNETRLRFAIKGVLPGQIGHMCKMVGLKMLSVRRIRVGRVPMAGLPSGQWRYLLGYERF